MKMENISALAAEAAPRSIPASNAMVAGQTVRSEIANIKKRLELLEFAAMTLADGNLLSNRKWEGIALRLQDSFEEAWHDVSWLLVEQNGNKSQFNEALRRKYLDALILACKDWVPANDAHHGATVAEALTQAVLQAVTEIQDSAA